MVKNKTRFGIRKKIILSLVIFVTLSLFSSIVISVWSFNSMGELGSEISSDALEDQAENHLIRQTEDIALNINTTLENVQNQVELLAKTAGNIWENPNSFPQRESYYHDKSVTGAPPDAYYDTELGYNREISLEYSCFKLPSDSYTSENLKKYETAINNSAKLDFTLKELKNQKQEFLWVYMGTEVGVHRSYPWHGPYNPDYDPRIRGWYKQAKEAEGEIVWGTPYNDINPPYLLIISCSKAVYANNQLVGVVAVDLVIDDIKDTILNFDFLKSGYAFLIDSKLTTIAHKDLQTVGTPITDLEGDGTDINAVLNEMSKLKTGVERIDEDDFDRFMAYTPIKSTNYILGIVVPSEEVLEHAEELKSETNSRSNDITRTFMVIGIVAIIIRKIMHIMILADRLISV